MTDEGSPAQGSQAAAAAEGPPAPADDVNIEEDSREQGLADTQVKTQALTQLGMPLVVTGSQAGPCTCASSCTTGQCSTGRMQRGSLAICGRGAAGRRDLCRQPAAPAEAPPTAEETPGSTEPAVAGEAAAPGSSAGSNEGPQGSESGVPAATLRFSLHRSHAQLYVSSAETAAACGSIDAAAVDALFTSSTAEEAPA